MRVDRRKFYDVKNAKLMDRRKDERVVQREPQVDMDKFTAFCQIANGVLKMARISFGFWQANRMPTWIRLSKR